MLELKQKPIAKSNQLLSGRVLEGCILYTPLWHGKLQGSPFPSLDQYHHSCTATNAPWTQQGRTCDGDDFISVANTAALNVTTGLTIEVWIKSAGGAGVYPGIVSRRSATQGYELTQNDDASIDFQLCDGTALYGLDARVNYTANVWNHLVGTFSQPNGKAYVNGVLNAATLTMNNPIENLNDVLYISRRISTGIYWNGTIGEIRIYSRALSASEIQHNYLSTRWRYA